MFLLLSLIFFLSGTGRGMLQFSRKSFESAWCEDEDEEGDAERGCVDSSDRHSPHGRFSSSSERRESVLDMSYHAPARVPKPKCLSSNPRAEQALGSEVLRLLLMIDCYRGGVLCS